MTSDARGAITEHLTGLGLADATVLQYGYMAARWHRHATGEGRDPYAPTAVGVRDWSKTLPPGVSTRDTAAQAMRHWCAMCGTADVSGAVERPQKNTRDRRTPLPKDVAAALLDEADRHGRRGCPIYLGLYAGLRVSEMATLRWDGFDFAGARIRLWRDKNDKWHEVPLHPALARRMAPVAAPKGWVFQASNLGHIHKATVRTWIKHVATAAGHPDVQAHDLRRTAARAVYDAGKRRDIMAAKGLMGHAKVTTTQLYIGSTLDDVRDQLDQVDYGRAS